MYNIAICDGSAKELLLVMRLLDSYCTERRPNTETCTDVFSRPDDLQQTFREKRYDLLILDMAEPGRRGIELARAAKTGNPNVDVIYIAGCAELAIEAFAVNAVSYLLRPFTEDQFRNSLDRAFRNIPEKKPAGIAIKSLSGHLMCVDVNDILYIESREKIIRIVQKETDDILVRSSLSSTYGHLGKYKHIVKCGSSYIINLDGVRKIDDRSVIMINGTAIPIPRRSVTEMKQRYSAYSNG